MIELLSSDVLSYDYDTLPTPSPYDPFLGQERLKNALALGCHLSDNCHHIFVVSDQVGQYALVQPITKLLSQHKRPQAGDCVYVHNFDNPKQPKALFLPAGHAHDFARQVHDAYFRCQKKLKLSLETLTHQSHRHRLKLQLQKNQAQAIDEFNKTAAIYNAKLTSTHLNIGELQAIDDSQPIHPKAQKALHRPLQILIANLNQLGNEYEQSTDELDQAQVKRIVDGVFAKLMTTDDKAISAYLNSYCQALLECDCNIACDDEWGDGLPPPRFLVNVISTPSSHPPIIHLTQPTLSKLAGCIQSDTSEHSRADVSTIKAGALHHANGGFLMVNANELLEQREAWHTLKHALLTKQIELSDGSHLLDQTNPSTLSPAPIALDIKVILIGDSSDYDELMADQEARFLFGIKADWAWQIANCPHGQSGLLGHINHIISTHGLLPFHNDAQKTILKALLRHTAHKHWLSLDGHYLGQLIKQSHAIASLAGDTKVQQSHVSQAITAYNDRHGSLWRYYWQELTDGKHLISTDGHTIGQVNALSVIDDGFYAFGLPTRLTARVTTHSDKTRIYDVERATNLGGDIHAKAVMIMSSFLRSSFSGQCPLDFSAYLVFEQNYEHIDGDSATLAKACALLSALAQAPINQALAITGSMNQLGQVQAVGGINAKIEGFFALCRHRGLTHTQGVIIPAANLNELMLGDEVVQAVSNKQFFIYAVDDVFDALTLLTGINASPAKAGKFANDSLFAQIINRLTTNPAL